jgi:tetratricopeptide (TPR) repeat protein
MIRGYLRRQQQRFAEAQADYEHGRSAFRCYREQSISYRGEQHNPEELLNDHVAGDLAQVTNNLAYTLALAGNLKRALRLSNEVIQEFVPILASYRQALFYNTNALILLLAGDFTSAEKPIQLAEQAAQDAGSSRVLGMVERARGFFERTRMNKEQDPRPEIEESYRRAASYLKGEPGTLYETYIDWAKFERDLSKLYRVQNPDMRDKLRQHDAAFATLPDEPSMQHVDVLENQITIYNNMARYDEAERLLDRAEAMMNVRMPAYGQILSGKLALQRFYPAFFRDHNPEKALQFLALALARVYVFASKHRDQQTFEALVAEHIGRIAPEYLHAFKQHTEREDLYITSDQLPHQRPNATHWSNAWEEAIAFMNQVIEERLDNCT